MTFLMIIMIITIITIIIINSITIINLQQSVLVDLFLTKFLNDETVVRFL